LKSFACIKIILRQVLINLELFRIPETDDVDCPSVISSAPVEIAVKISIIPIIIKYTTQIIQKIQGITQ